MRLRLINSGKLQIRATEVFDSLIAYHFRIIMKKDEISSNLILVTTHPNISIDLKFKAHSELTGEEVREGITILSKLRDYFLCGLPDISSLIHFKKE